jgi:hypothetical protein
MARIFPFSAKNVCVSLHFFSTCSGCVVALYVCWLKTQHPGIEPLTVPEVQPIPSKQVPEQPARNDNKKKHDKDDAPLSPLSPGSPTSPSPSSSPQKLVPRQSPPLAPRANANLVNRRSSAEPQGGATTGGGVGNSAGDSSGVPAGKAAVASSQSEKVRTPSPRAPWMAMRKKDAMTTSSSALGSRQPSPQLPPRKNSRDQSPRREISPNLAAQRNSKALGVHKRHAAQRLAESSQSFPSYSSSSSRLSSGPPSPIRRTSTHTASSNSSSASSVPSYEDVVKRVTSGQTRAGKEGGKSKSVDHEIPAAPPKVSSSSSPPKHSPAGRAARAAAAVKAKGFPRPAAAGESNHNKATDIKASSEAVPPPPVAVPALLSASQVL